VTQPPSAEALRARAERLTAELPSGGAAIARDVANVHWLTGLAGEPHQLYDMAPLRAVVGPSGEVRIVAPASELAWIEEQRGLEGVIAHGKFFLAGEPSTALREAISRSGTLLEALRQALGEVGAGARVVLDGGERTGLDPQLEGSFADSVLLSPQAWLRARAGKDAGELAALRAANAVAEAAIVAALGRARPGCTEAELVGWLRETMVRAGARPMLASVGFGERGALVDFTASPQRRLAEGEPIRLDVGCTVSGYHADLARTAVLGEPPAWLAEAHQALLAGEQAAIDGLRAGANGAELHELAVQGTRAAGLAEYSRTHCGHGIGLAMYEPPLLAPGQSEPIEAGMTLCVETPLYLIGKAGIQIEDAVVVTESGCERLGQLPRQLLAAGPPARGGNDE